MQISSLMIWLLGLSCSGEKLSLQEHLLFAWALVPALHITSVGAIISQIWKGRISHFLESCLLKRFPFCYLVIHKISQYCYTYKTNSARNLFAMYAEVGRKVWVEVVRFEFVSKNILNAMSNYCKSHQKEVVSVEFRKNFPANLPF